MTTVVTTAEQVALRPLIARPGRGYWIVVGLLLGVSALGLGAWAIQIRDGMRVTGLSSAVPWGTYVVNFIFFVGISYAGTLLSAVLRLVGAEWRRPVTRIAELVTVSSLFIAGVMIFVDLGQPFSAPVRMLQFGRAGSPIIWDVVVLGTYFTAAVLFLLLPLIPDSARLRDRSDRPRLRRLLYRVTALGWHGSPAQEERLHRAMKVLAITIIPIAILAHSAVGWIFGITPRPVWNSTIFAPYFVVGAVFSGTAVIILAMAVYRRFFNLGELITEKHFRNLGYILLALNLAYMYLVFSEYWTIGYHVKADYQAPLAAILSGRQAWAFWFSIILGMLLPAALIALPWTRTIGGISVASLLVVVGMWVKRWIIVVPPLETGMTPGSLGTYTPTLIEVAITAGALAAFTLIFLLFQRFYPVVAVWELEQGTGGEAEGAGP